MALTGVTVTVPSDLMYEVQLDTPYTFTCELTTDGVGADLYWWSWSSNAELYPEDNPLSDTVSELSIQLIWPETVGASEQVLMNWYTAGSNLRRITINITEGTAPDSMEITTPDAEALGVNINEDIRIESTLTSEEGNDADDYTIAISVPDGGTSTALSTAGQWDVRFSRAGTFFVTVTWTLTSDTTVVLSDTVIFFASDPTPPDPPAPDPDVLEIVIPTLDRVEVETGATATITAGLTTGSPGSASDYTIVWTVPSGVTLTSGQGTSTLRVSFPTAGTYSIVTTWTHDTTANELTDSVMYVVSDPPPDPMPEPDVMEITLPKDERVMVETDATATIRAELVGSSPGSASDYTIVWTVPSGVTISSGQGTGTINVEFPTAGTYNIVTTWTHDTTSDVLTDSVVYIVTNPPPDPMPPPPLPPPPMPTPSVNSGISGYSPWWLKYRKGKRRRR